MESLISCHCFKPENIFFNMYSSYCQSCSSGTS